MKRKDCPLKETCEHQHIEDFHCWYQERNEKQHFNWQSFRAEAAKEFTAALLSVIDWEHTYNENIIKQAIDLADELVKALKEKEEK